MYLLQDDERVNSPNVLVPMAIEGLPTAEKLPNLNKDEIIVAELGTTDGQKIPIVCETIAEMQVLYLKQEMGWVSLRWFKGFFVKDVGVVLRGSTS